MRSCLLALTWLGALLLLALQQRGSARAAPGATSTLTSSRPLNSVRVARDLIIQEPVNRAAQGEPRYARNRGVARPAESLVLLDEIKAAVEEDKRQFDDYGHMRFGKRGPQQQRAFDDYGHMRFGRSGTD